MHAYDASRRSKHYVQVGCTTKVSGVSRLVGVQRAVQNNGDVKSEPKIPGCEVSQGQYMPSTVELFLFFFFCSLGFYGGLTSWFYSLSESLAVGRIQHSLLHLTSPNTYVAKAQPRSPPRPPLPKTSSRRRHVMHMVSNILPGRDRRRHS